MSEPGHDISFRNGDMEEICTLGVYTSVQYEARRNDVGDWSLRFPLLNARSYLQEATSAVLSEEATGIVIRRRGERKPIFSGDFVDTYVVESGQKGEPGGITINGASDNAILSGEHAWPMPGREVSTTSLTTMSTTHDVFTGTAEAAITHFLQRNIGVPALLPRRSYKWLEVNAPAGVGSGVQGTWKARFDVLLELCQSIANHDDLIFDLRQSANANRVRAYISAVQDRPDLLFSREGGSLVAATLVSREPDVTESLALGTGVMENRVMTRRIGHPGRSSVRRVMLREQSSEDDLDILQQDLKDANTEGEAQAGAQVITKEKPGMRPGIDFWVGDRVRVKLGTKPITEVVNGVAVVDEGAGVVSTAKVGSGEESPAQIKKIRQIARDLARATRG